MSEQAPDQPPIPADVLECLAKGGPAWGAQDYVSAKRYANEALELARHHNSELGELGALHMLANIAFNECDDPLSQKLHESVLAKSREIGYWEGAASSLTNLALLDLVKGDSESARDKYQQAIQAYESSNHFEMAEHVRSILAKEKIEAALDGIPRIPAKKN